MNPNADYVPLIDLPVEWEWTLMKTGQVLAIMILLLLSLAFLLLFDRKVWAAVQLRKGPERRRARSACFSPSRTSSSSCSRKSSSRPARTRPCSSSRR